MDAGEPAAGELTDAAVSCIDHVAVAVTDADAASAYYREHLGLAVAHDERLPAIGVRLMYLRAGTTQTADTMVQLVQPIGDGPVADFLAEHGEGLHHVCFAVPALDDALDVLPGESGTGVFAGGRGRRACFLSARPGGALIELTETGTPWRPS
jgi:methylmalonyl-CoA/ethylmalonyl-CoA epimerase